MNSEKILIISYLFPPSAGIGGRRWAKIAKHWLNEENDVEVIASYNKKDNQGPWDQDISRLLDENRIIYTKIDYPDILNSFSKKSILREIQYRLALFYVKFITNGNYYDRSIFWKKRVEKIVEKKIANGFTNVVATGAPFHYIKLIVELKGQHPKLKVWVDLRDPWSWGSGYGMSVLSKDRIDFEKNIERFVIENADLVTVPIQNMYSHLIKTYPNASNIKVLPHFYDPDDLPSLNNEKEPGIIALISAGTIYEGTKETIIKVANILVDLSISGTNVKWTFYVSEPSKLSFLLKDSKYNDIIKICGIIPSNEVLSKISVADHYIAIYPEVFKDHLSTKFPELYALNSSIIYIGAKGEISDFIIENSIGETIESVEIDLKLAQLIKNRKTVEILDRDKFSVRSITKTSFSDNLN